MKKVRKKVCNNEIEYNAAKPKNATRIFFKKIDETGGAYEISNKGHIRSGVEIKKIIKYYYSKSGPRINLRNNKKQVQFYISKLMAKYHPNELKLWRELHCT